MNREKMKSIFVVHTNGEDEWIKVSKRTYKKMIDMVYDYHETRLEKACEILQNANMAEIERHFAECKAKDERIEAQSSVIIACQNAITQKDERIAELEALAEARREQKKSCKGCFWSQHPRAEKCGGCIRSTAVGDHYFGVEAKITKEG